MQFLIKVDRMLCHVALEKIKWVKAMQWDWHRCVAESDRRSVRFRFRELAAAE